jgi:hypothetical protein
MLRPGFLYAGQVLLPTYLCKEVAIPFHHSEWQRIAENLALQIIRTRLQRKTDLFGEEL